MSTALIHSTEPGLHAVWRYEFSELLFMPSARPAALGAPAVLLPASMPMISAAPLFALAFVLRRRQMLVCARTSRPAPKATPAAVLATVFAAVRKVLAAARQGLRAVCSASR